MDDEADSEDVVSQVTERERRQLQRARPASGKAEKAGEVTKVNCDA